MSRAPRYRRTRVVGVASLVEAATFIFGFALFASVLADYTAGDLSPAESAAFVADHETTFYVWHLVILVLFGIVLVPLSIGLRDLLRRTSELLASLVFALGVIWAALVIAAGMIANIGVATLAELTADGSADAAAVWSALEVVQDGLGGGNEVVGGVWTLLASYGLVRAALIPRALAAVGVVAGVAGVLTVIPALEALGAVFGVGLIVWFGWLGFLMVGRPVRAARDARALVGR